MATSLPAVWDENYRVDYLNWAPGPSMSSADAAHWRSAAEQSALLCGGWFALLGLVYGAIVASALNRKSGGRLGVLAGATVSVLLASFLTLSWDDWRAETGIVGQLFVIPILSLLLAVPTCLLGGVLGQRLKPTRQGA